MSVFPSPGTVSASPSTSISFRGVPRERLGTLVVDGSRSGRHTGRWRPHSDGRGASWTSGERFLRGERVTVRSALTVAGTRNGDFAFRIARIPDRVTIPKTVLEDIEPGRLRSFQSRRDLQPPHVTVDPNRGPTEPGYIFLSPKSKKDLKQAGPMIVDNAGRLVWFRPLPGIRAATDFRAQTYLGRPVLTYWDGGGSPVWVWVPAPCGCGVEEGFDTTRSSHVEFARRERVVSNTDEPQCRMGAGIPDPVLRNPIP